jgi:hypothetical protein
LRTVVDCAAYVARISTASEGSCNRPPLGPVRPVQRLFSSCAGVRSRSCRRRLARPDDWLGANRWAAHVARRVFITTGDVAPSVAARIGGLEPGVRPPHTGVPRRHDASRRARCLGVAADSSPSPARSRSPGGADDVVRITAPPSRGKCCRANAVLCTVGCERCRPLHHEVATGDDRGLGDHVVQDVADIGSVSTTVTTRPALPPLEHRKDKPGHQPERTVRRNLRTAAKGARRKGTRAPFADSASVRYSGGTALAADHPGRERGARYGRIRCSADLGRPVAAGQPVLGTSATESPLTCRGTPPTVPRCARPDAGGRSSGR